MTTIFKEGPVRFSIVFVSFVILASLTIQSCNKDEAAIETEIKYKVTFNTFGGTAVAEQLVVKDSTAKKPTDPTRTNSVFTGGWYTADQLAANPPVAYDFKKAVTTDLTLYSAFLLNSITVKIDINGGASANNSPLPTVADQTLPVVLFNGTPVYNSKGTPENAIAAYFQQLGNAQVNKAGKGFRGLSHSKAAGSAADLLIDVANPNALNGIEIAKMVRVGAVTSDSKNSATDTLYVAYY